MMASVLRPRSRPLRRANHSPLEGESNPQSGLGGGYSRKAGIRSFRHFLSILLLLPLLTGFTAEATAQPVVGITSGPAVTEGTAASFTVSVTPTRPTGSPLSVAMLATQTGAVMVGGPAILRTVTIPGGSSSITTSFDTNNDSTQEVSGIIRADISASDDFSYTIDTNNPHALVTVHDNDTIISVALPSTEGVTRRDGALVLDDR